MISGYDDDDDDDDYHHHHHHHHHDIVGNNSGYNDNNADGEDNDDDDDDNDGSDSDDNQQLLDQTFVCYEESGLYLVQSKKVTDHLKRREKTVHQGTRLREYEDLPLLGLQPKGKATLLKTVRANHARNYAQ